MPETSFVFFRRNIEIEQNGGEVVAELLVIAFRGFSMSFQPNAGTVP
jgi:hypothetical protein